MHFVEVSRFPPMPVALSVLYLVALLGGTNYCPRKFALTRTAPPTNQRKRSTIVVDCSLISRFLVNVLARMRKSWQSRICKNDKASAYGLSTAWLKQLFTSSH
jgi:hypothetical protein